VRPSEPSSSSGRDRALMKFDCLIKGGRLVDPASRRDGPWDLGIRRDRIAAVDVDIPSDTAFQVIDASDKLVTPGLVDLHTHVFHGVGYWGVDAESTAAQSGVTTWIDAGSAGALTLAGLRRYVIDETVVKIFALLNVSYLGLIAPDYELAREEFWDRAILERVVNENRDCVLGLKIRMGSPTVGSHGLRPMKTAVEVANACDLPLMVHIAESPPDVSDVLDLMRPGDILTHCFTGASMRIINDDGQPKEAALRARERGVIMDIGHGVGSFTFTTAEALLSAGFFPDVISTDIHQLSIGGPMHDLPTCMAKFLALGMSLEDVVRATTTRPAQVIGLDDVGTLIEGSSADVAIFELMEGDFPLYDIEGEVRHGRQALRHIETIIQGRVMARRPSPPPAPWAQPGKVWPSRQAELLAHGLNREGSRPANAPERAPTS
jgi:dihydroorotase